MTDPLALRGAPGSPYTRKMLAVLRFRRIPYRFLVGIWRERARDEGLPRPKVDLLPTSWVQTVEDLSGMEPAEGDWVDRDEVPETLRALLVEMGRTYVPVMLANAQAIDAGADQVTAEVDGKPWTQRPFPYQAKCLQWVRQEYARLDGTDRDFVDDILAGTGCEALF